MGAQTKACTLQMGRLGHVGFTHTNKATQVTDTWKGAYRHTARGMLIMKMQIERVGYKCAEEAGWFRVGKRGMLGIDADLQVTMQGQGHMLPST